MLVLSRKAGQKIIIAGNIEVTIVELGNDRVRIGVNAPAEIPVHRQEVFERLERERAQQLPPTQRWTERDLIATR
jgi:carbon storage regulator